MRKLMMLVAAVGACVLVGRAEVVYSDATVRFTLVDDATVRMEYAPDGKFVDNKSFVAVVREQGSVAH